MLSSPFCPCIKKRSCLTLKACLLPFSKGHKTLTWKRFTEEFAPRGLIATSTAKERDLASMPTSNDANEGMLGSWRQFSRAKPSLTVSHFTDQIMFSRNNTQAFMDEMFVEEDHAHIRRGARRIDPLGIESQRQEMPIEHGRGRVAAVRQKAEDRAAKVAQVDAHFAAIKLVTNHEQLLSVSNTEICDQIELHRRLSIEKDIPKKSHIHSKKQRLDVLIKLVERHGAHQRGEVLTGDAFFIPSEPSMSIDNNHDEGEVSLN